MKINKLIAGVLSLTLLQACAAVQSTTKTTATPTTPSTVTITSYNGDKQQVETEVPYAPERVAVLDMAALDILQSLDLSDHVVGSASTSLPYLKDVAEKDGVTPLGTIKEADLEAVMASEPDVIFIGGRLASIYDELSKIAPVVYLQTDSEKGVVQSTHDNAMTIASMYGVEDKVDELIQQYQSRIEKLQTAAKGHTAIVGLTTSGSLNILNDESRGSLIGKEIGFTNLGNEQNTSTHGSEASFEYVLEKNPEYIFVIDRDRAINTSGAKLADEIMNNELVNQTTAAKDNHVVILENPAVWYTAEGGIEALGMMLSDLEKGLGMSK